MDTIDNGHAGLAETGDEVVFTFSAAVDPASILAGWDGSATPVVVHITGAGSDVLTVRNAANTADLTELGSVQTNGDYATPTADFTGSQMSLRGSTITIVLGTLSGTNHHDPSAKTMVWTTPHGAATESGHPDSNF